jgi:hypothetical protein
VRPAGFDHAQTLASLRKPFWEEQISNGLLDMPLLDAESLLASSAAILKRPRMSVYLDFQGETASGYAYEQVGSYRARYPRWWL